MKLFPLKISDSEIASRLCLDQDFVWLDSAGSGGRYSILVFEAGECKKFGPGDSTQNFLSFLNEISSQKSPHSNGLPFTGGWVGYMAYEAYAFNPLIPLKPKFYKKYPVAVFKHYDHGIVIDHHQKTAHFVSSASDPDKDWERLQKRFSNPQKISSTTRQKSSSYITSKTSKQVYKKDFLAVQEALNRGDYFELNYTMEFCCEYKNDPFALYSDLRQVTKAPMMCFGRFDDVTILSASPERFFCVDQDKIETFPIKGTRRRSDDPVEDQKLIKELIKSPKDQAELLMVTDMLRSDLGRVCDHGTVRVSELARVASFPYYHHLISHIEGTLSPGKKLSDIFQALFPGGSITGAPKIQVMEHTAELENRARGLYTGAIGYISHSGHCDFNIPIRTMTWDGKELEFATGSGLVVDSECEGEYSECQLKAQGLLSALCADFL